MRRDILTAGGVTIDIIVSGLPCLCKPGEVIRTAQKIKTIPGGHAFNISVDLAKLGLDGGNIDMIAAIGQDGWENYINRELDRYNIKSNLMTVKDETAKNVILVVRGEDRRYHVDLGANLKLDPERIIKTIKVNKPHIFYIGPTGILGKTDSCLGKILKTAKEIKALTVVDITFPYKKGWKYLLSSLPFVDILHGGIAECSALTDKNKPSQILKFLFKKGVGLPIITDGKEGLVTYFEGKSAAMRCFDAKVIDTTGAGDAFCAGLIYAINLDFKKQNRSIEYFFKKLGKEKFVHYLNFASATAATAVESVGTTTGVSLNRTKKLLNTHRRLELEML